MHVPGLMKYNHSVANVLKLIVNVLVQLTYLHVSVFMVVLISIIHNLHNRKYDNRNKGPRMYSTNAN